MARFWTSPNSTAYVDDDVFIKIAFPEPIPEPDFDVLMTRIIETTRGYARDNGGIVGKRYRIDDDDMTCEENPTAIIDGLQYVTYTGILSIFCNCEDGQGEELQNDLMADIREYSGQIVSYEACGNY